MPVEEELDEPDVEPEDELEFPFDFEPLLLPLLLELDELELAAAVAADESLLDPLESSESLVCPGALPEFPGASDAVVEAADDSVVAVPVSAAVSVDATSAPSAADSSWPLLLSLALSLFEKPGPTATTRSDASALQTAATRNCFHQTVRLPMIPSL